MFTMQNWIPMLQSALLWHQRVEGWWGGVGGFSNGFSPLRWPGGKCDPRLYLPVSFPNRRGQESRAKRSAPSDAESERGHIKRGKGVFSSAPTKTRRRLRPALQSSWSDQQSVSQSTTWAKWCSISFVLICTMWTLWLPPFLCLNEHCGLYYALQCCIEIIKYGLHVYTSLITLAMTWTILM